MKIQVCIIGSMAPYQNGGPAVYVDGLSKELAKNIDVCVITWGPEKRTYRDKYGREIHVIKAKRLRTLRAIIKAWKLRKEYDILHVNHVIPANIAHFFIRKPIVLTVHGYYTYEAVSRGKIKENSISFRLMLNAEKKAMKRADVIIAVGKTLRKWIIKELSANSEKVFYIPNGVNPEVFKSTPPEKNPLTNKINGSPVLLFTKHFSPRYGAKDLIRALRKIVEKYPNAKLVMTNEDKWKKEIVDFAKKNEVLSNTIFTGRVALDELIGLYSLADVFVHPSINEQETFGISLIEAMACERPVVATAVGGPKEILEEGLKQMGKPVGLSAPPKDPNALAEAIIYLLEHPKEAREMGKRAREHVIKNYTWSIAAKKALEAYKFALEKY